MFRRKFLSMVLLGGMLISQSVPKALAATYYDQAQFVSDLTAPDGSSFAPGAPFTKTWRLMNASNREAYCDELTKVFPLSKPWPYPNIRYYNLYKPATPGVELDFRTWLIGFEYINNQPFLHSMVTIVWEP